jgi:RHS repeat-associated protein
MLVLFAAFSIVFNEGGQPTEAVDPVHGESIFRRYDDTGLLIEEQFPQDLTVQSSYDDDGRRTELRLPDGSKVTYAYDGPHLVEVTRLSPTGTPLYTYHYGPSSDQMIGNSGTLAWIFDPLGRKVGFTSPWGTENVVDHAPDGRITRMERFGRDATFSYDAEGRLEESYHDEPMSLLSFDCDNTLIAIEWPKQRRETFTYDGFHRRQTISLFSWSNGEWMQTSYRRLFYDGPLEIGAVDEMGTIVELRILGNTPYADIGAAIAVELQGRPYAPLHDLLGSLIGLVDPETRELVSWARYSPFGHLEESWSHLPLPCPWGFWSKRCDPLTGWYDFGHRFYRPGSHRWLTPDPLGPVDHPDSTTFAQDCPLLYYDLYGLETTFSSMAIWMGKAVQHYCYHVVPFSFARKIGFRFSYLLGAPQLPTEDFHVGTVGSRCADPTRAFLWINGINTNLEETRGFAALISEALDGETIRYAYNSTRGISADLWEAIVEKVFLEGKAFYVTRQALREALQDIGPNGAITIFVHSEGGMILERVLDYFSPSEQAQMRVYTFGTAAFFSKKNLQSLLHVLSTGDQFPWLIDPYRYLVYRIWTPSLLRLAPHGGPWWHLLHNHAFDGSTYRNALLQVCEQEKN